jgi:hypothetical protein
MLEEPLDLKKLEIILVVVALVPPTDHAVAMQPAMLKIFIPWSGTHSHVSWMDFHWTDWDFGFSWSRIGDCFLNLKNFDVQKDPDRRGLRMRSRLQSPEPISKKVSLSKKVSSDGWFHADGIQQ